MKSLLEVLCFCGEGGAAFISGCKALKYRHSVGGVISGYETFEAFQANPSSCWSSPGPFRFWGNIVAKKISQRGRTVCKFTNREKKLFARNWKSCILKFSNLWMERELWHLKWEVYLLLPNDMATPSIGVWSELEFFENFFCTKKVLCAKMFLFGDF